jgi:uncharacterized membrane protein|tara:strand:+ start:300 stop:554 length:255 start_codon:yes stop_codon:yes gene_type:complete
MDRALTIFIYLWAGIFVLLNVVGIIGQFYLHGFSGGLSYIQEIYSPFNVINYIFSIVVLSPAIGVYYWREKKRGTRRAISADRE